MPKENPGAEKAKLAAEQERLTKTALEQEKIAADLAAEKEAIEAERREIRAVKARLNREMEVFEVAKGRTYNLSELGEGKGIEKVSEADFVKSAEMEAFMNERVLVRVDRDGTPGALPVVVVTVNGTNQPIIRGKEQWVKRKYVEALARSRITNYEQDVPDPSKPENIRMVDVTALTYNFSVIEDKNPDGRPWLQAILDQP